MTTPDNSQTTNLPDIVTRLRATGGKGQCGPIKAEAADEIERLRAIRKEAAEAIEDEDYEVARILLRVGKSRLTA